MMTFSLSLAASLVCFALSAAWQQFLAISSAVAYISSAAEAEVEDCMVALLTADSRLSALMLRVEVVEPRCSIADVSLAITSRV